MVNALIWIVSVTLLAVIQSSQAQTSPGRDGPSPLAAGSAWVGIVKCGPDQWQASIQVDARNNSTAELSAIVEQQRKTVRMRIQATGSPTKLGAAESFDLIPVESGELGNPFAGASGTRRTNDLNGLQSTVISWRPVDGPMPRCLIGMRLSHDGSTNLNEATVAGTIKLFGLTINGPLEVPACGASTQQVRRCSPSGTSCWNESVSVPERLPVCFAFDRSHIRFNQEKQPAWARGPIGVRLDGHNRVVYVEFRAANSGDVLRELNAAFGPPTRIDSRTRSQGDRHSCIVISNVVDCKQVQRAEEWTEHTQVWRSSAVEARFEEGSNRAMVMSLMFR